jgi:hypothetical protein
MPKDDATPSAASRGSHAELIGRLAETIGADGPSLTQSIRIDVNVHKEPTVTVTRFADADQIGRIIQCSTWADYTLVQNDELKRLRNNATLTAEEREAVEWFSHFARPQNGPVIGGHAATLRGLLERLG